MTPAMAKMLPLSVARQQDAAVYITALIHELHQISMAAGLDEITVHLEQAFYEAIKLTPKLSEMQAALSQVQPVAESPADARD